MSEKRSYLVREPFRFGGQRHNVGDAIDLTVADAADLGIFLEGEKPARVVLVADDETSGQSIAELLAALGLKEKTIETLNGQLAERESDLDELTAENTRNKADLKTALERIVPLEAERDMTRKDLSFTNDELAAARAQIAGLEQQLAAAVKPAPAPKKGGKS